MVTESMLGTGRKTRNTSTLVCHGHRALSCERAMWVVTEGLFVAGHGKIRHVIK